MANKCEAYFNGKWHIIDMETALLYPELTKRCVECKGAVRIHKSGGTIPAHAEHKKRFNHCSLSFYYDGVNRINPEQPNPKNVTLDLLPEEVITNDDFEEGGVVKIMVNKYERDPKARKACLKHHGYSCKVCNLNMESVYGKIAKDFIHVHHIIPLAKVGNTYKIDPKKDLVPVCPNCHSIIHRRAEPYSIQEIQILLNKQDAKKLKA